MAVRAGAVALPPHSDGERFLSALRSLDEELAAVLDGHVVAAKLLATLEPGRARNAVLGDIGRGDLVTVARNVNRWEWNTHAVTVTPSLRAADGELIVGDYPGLYDTILAVDAAIGAVIAISTHRHGVRFEPVADGWAVLLDDVTFHADELIPLPEPETLNWRNL